MEEIILMDQPLLITWEPSNEIGIRIIDEQHRGIVSVINAFAFSIRRDQKADLHLNTIFTMVDCYTKLHFSTEEEFFSVAGYPEAKEHKELHIALISKSFSVAAQSIRLRDPNIYLQFLKEWWMEHINTSDRAYAPLVRKYPGLGDS